MDGDIRLKKLLEPIQSREDHAEEPDGESSLCDFCHHQRRRTRFRHQRSHEKPHRNDREIGYWLMHYRVLRDRLSFRSERASPRAVSYHQGRIYPGDQRNCRSSSTNMIVPSFFNCIIPGRPFRQRRGMGLFRRSGRGKGRGTKHCGDIFSRLQHSLCPTTRSPSPCKSCPAA